MTKIPDHRNKWQTAFTGWCTFLERKMPTLTLFAIHHSRHHLSLPLSLQRLCTWWSSWKVLQLHQRWSAHGQCVIHYFPGSRDMLSMGGLKQLRIKLQSHTSSEVGRWMGRCGRSDVAVGSLGICAWNGTGGPCHIKELWCEKRCSTCKGWWSHNWFWCLCWGWGSSWSYWVARCGSVALGVRNGWAEQKCSLGKLTDIVGADQALIDTMEDG